MFKGFFFTFLLFFSFNGFSQIFGGNPSSLKWKQINTSASRVIFPEGLDSVAKRITNIISFINEPTENTIGKKSKKINIVLQNQTTISNGYVGLGPFRSEFYLTPDQNSFSLGSLPWPDQLTIHEFRHVQQYNNFNVGLSKIMRTVFGEEGQILSNNTAVPNWFFEGDAVFNETNLSKQGRGSLPSFFEGYRALWQAGKKYSWMKLRNGSYKDFVPDHYPLGYMLVAYGREKYGDQFWEKVTHDAAAFKSLFYPFQHAIKKYSGENFVSFRNHALRFFKDQFDTAASINKNGSHKYLDEQFPSFAEDGSLIFVKSGYQQIPEFIIRKNNNDIKLRKQDYTLEKYFSYRNGKIIYAAYRPDLRWGYRNYSDLRIIDVQSGQQKTITKNTKYFSPDISGDGGQIVAVNESPQGFAQLHLLDANTGKLLEIIPNPDHLFYTYPKFYGNKKIISAVRDTEGKMSLAETDLSNNKTDYLLPFTFNVIGFPAIYHDTIYFSYSYLKNDALFAYTFRDKKLWKIDCQKTNGIGKYYPSVNDANIAWSSFATNGYKVQEIAKSDLEFVEINPEKMSKVTSSFGITALNNTNSNLLFKVPNNSFGISRYKKSFQLFNFHSIEPAVNDPQYTLSLISENILNTLQSDLSLTYDRAEKFKKVGFSATYGGFFPFLSAGINYTFDRSTIFRQQKVYFNQLEPFAGFNIPLNFSNKRSFTYLNFGSQYVYNKSTFQGIYKDTLGSISYSYLSNFLSFTNQIQKANQQIFPAFAQAFSFSYKSALSHFSGNQFVAQASFYFPGIAKTHSLVLNGAYLKKDSSGQISFSSGFPFSRGYQSVNLFKMYKWGANYHLPLLYPDAGFGNIIYLLRVRGNLFYDDTQVKDFKIGGGAFNAKFRSIGTEINFDTKWWNQANISFGFRYSYLLDRDVFGGTGRNRWEIILPVNIFQ
jgi:hypothetical protein